MSKIDELKSSVKRVAGYWNKPPEGRYLPFKEMASYAAGGMGVNFTMNIIYILIQAQFLPVMYDIKMFHGTAIVAVAAFAQLLIQPILGKILDGIHKSKHGKFQTFLMWFTPIMAIVLILATWTPQFSGDSAQVFRTIFAYVTSVPTLILSQMWVAVYNMVPSTMTPDTQERTDMLSPVGLITSFAPTLLNVVVGPIREFFANRGMEYMAFRILGILFALIGWGLAYLIVFKTKERVYYEKDKKNEEEKIPFFDGIKQVFKNKPFMIFQLANIPGILRVFFNSQMMFIATYKFYDTYGPGPTLWSALSLIVGFGATPGMILVPFITRKISKKWTFLFAQGLMTIPIAIAGLIGFQNLPTGGITIPFMVITGFLINLQAGVGLVVSPALTADQYDYQQYKTGNRLEGFMNTVTTWIAGLGGALLQFIPVMIQEKMGFQPGSAAFRPEEGVPFAPEILEICNKWFNAAALITVICSVLWIVILAVGYHFNEKEHKQIMEVIKARAVDSSFGVSVGGDTAQAGEFARELTEEIEHEMHGGDEGQDK